VGGPRSQGALSRPWALMWNPVGVRGRRGGWTAFPEPLRGKFGCPGCFNPDTHDSMAGYDSDTENLAAEIVSLGTTIEVATGPNLPRPAHRSALPARPCASRAEL
jgi:hypothetical protein